MGEVSTCAVEVKMAQGEGLQWGMLDRSQEWLKGGPSTSLWKFGKLIGYFEEAPGPSQTWDNVISGDKAFLSLAHKLTPAHSCILSLATMWV